MTVSILVNALLPCSAATVTLLPDSDATLIGATPNNSMGAIDYFIAGTTQNGPTNRALLRFDIAAAIPSGNRITAASLTMTATRQSREAPVGAGYGLHRMLVSWAEGTNVVGLDPGLGLPAAPGDSTWNARAFPSIGWSQPGGGEGAEFLGQVTSSAFVDMLAPFAFEATFELIEDVQFWLDHPESNFGWMLKCEAEDTRFTARRFASREYADPLLAPQLTVQYEPLPTLSIARTNAGFVDLSFPAESGSNYAIEYRTSLATNAIWTTLTNFGFIVSSGTLHARDSVSGSQRFYRTRIQ